MNYSTVIQYFENIATRLKDIAFVSGENKRFIFYLDTELPDAKKIGSGAFKEPTLILFPFDIRSAGQSSRNLMHEYSINFCVCKAFNVRESSSVIQALDECKIVADKVLKEISHGMSENASIFSPTNFQHEGNSEFINTDIIGFTYKISAQKFFSIAINPDDYL